MTFNYQIATILILLALPLQYFVYKKRFGFKDPIGAKVFFYQQLCNVVVVSFIILQPLNSISTELQFGVTALLMIAAYTAIYYLQKKFVKNTKIS